MLLTSFDALSGHFPWAGISFLSVGWGWCPWGVLPSFASSRRACYFLGEVGCLWKAALDNSHRYLFVSGTQWPLSRTLRKIARGGLSRASLLGGAVIGHHSGTHPFLYHCLLSRTIHWSGEVSVPRSPTISPSILGTSWSILQVHHKAKWGASKWANKTQETKGWELSRAECPPRVEHCTGYFNQLPYFPWQWRWLDSIVSIQKQMWKVKVREVRHLSKDTQYVWSSVNSSNSSLSNSSIFTSPWYLPIKPPFGG